MAYTKQNFSDGNPLYADQLNHIEQGIVDAEGQIPKKTSALVNDSGYITDYSESDPTVPSWAKQVKKPDYTAAEVGADPAGTAVAEVADHNTSENSHTDIRLELQTLTTKLNNFLDSDDTTLDELSELITAIKANAGTISQLTSGKVNVADIVNNLTTNVTNKPLSAAQGVALKKLVDTLNTSLANYQPKGDYALKSEVPIKTSQLSNDSGFVADTELDGAVADALAQAKLSGDFDGQRGTGILNTTTGIQSYTTTVGGVKPTYRILLTTLKTQSLVDNVYVGDTVRYSAFLYPIIYVDESYAYMGTRVSIQGTAGTSVTVKSVTESTEPGGSNIVTFSDNKTLTVKNGSDYVLTEADKQEISGLIDAIPDYVVTEAESVIDRVVEAQGNRTFTFAAITDLHYGNAGNTEGVQHACQALRYIDARIKLDAVAVLGDYTDGYPDAGLVNAIGDFRTINSVLNGLRFAPNLRIQGNHDYYIDHGPVVRRYIQAYSDDVVWGDRAAGYFYRDFEEFKIRAICLNTTETDNANIACSTEQYDWFINSLDMSERDDAADWSILILSHHPLDWYVQDSTYRFGNILWAYKNGTSWSGGGVTCNFAGKNSATIIANIHGHIHNLLTGSVYRNTGAISLGTSGVVRMCTPEACIGRANQYDAPWKESTSYDKTAGTAEETSFVVYCIDLDTHLITAVCYGAGYDRAVDYINGVQVIKYSITNNLTNVTSNNDALTEIEAGYPYTATLTPTGASITSVKVMMGGVDVTSTVYSGGVINIAAVSGDIVITAVGAAPVTYTNMIPLAVTNTGAAYVGTNGEDGYKRGYRLNSSGAEAAATDFGCTGFIPVKRDDVVYFKNISLVPGVEDGSGNYIACFNGSFGLLGSVKSTNIKTGSSAIYLIDPFAVYEDTGYIKSITMSDNQFADGGYIRISAKTLDANSIITINEEIT